MDVLLEDVGDGNCKWCGKHIIKVRVSRDDDGYWLHEVNHRLSRHCEGQTMAEPGPRVERTNCPLCGAEIGGHRHEMGNS